MFKESHCRVPPQAVSFQIVAATAELEESQWRNGTRSKDRKWAENGCEAFTFRGHPTYSYIGIRRSLLPR